MDELGLFFKLYRKKALLKNSEDVKVVESLRNVLQEPFF